MAGTSSVTGKPQAGDVVFTYSGGLEATGSCILQRIIFAKSFGPWFSHVAVALSDSMAIEATVLSSASSAAWTGAKLENGVRLQLIPDLLTESQHWRVLRHPGATPTAAQLDVDSPDIAVLVGSGYSTAPLIAAAKQTGGVLAQLVPQGRFDWNAPPDAIACCLRDDPQLCKDLTAHLSATTISSLTDDYFCSQLVGYLLARVGLLDSCPGVITPCELYDQLRHGEWADVSESDYEVPTASWWRGTLKKEWEIRYLNILGVTKFRRQHVATMGLLGVAGDKTLAFRDRLDAIGRAFASRNSDVIDGRCSAVPRFHP